jgi:predicted lipoprotein with Yx(FWY)xxD motif
MRPPSLRVSRPKYRRPRWIVAVLAAATAVIAVTGMALARSTPSLSISRHVTVAGTPENVVATPRGLTVYTLSGESTHHLKCTQANGCFAAWIPVATRKTTSSLSSPSGVHGALGELRRNGMRQLTLGGRPLYTFVGDGGKARRSSGEGITSFGGTWHVVATSTSQTMAPLPGTTTTSSTSTSSNPYPGYP